MEASILWFNRALLWHHIKCGMDLWTDYTYPPSSSGKPLISPRKVHVGWEWRQLFLVKPGYVLPNIHLLNYFSYQTMSKDLRTTDRNGQPLRTLGVFSLSLLSGRLWVFCAMIILYHMEDLLEVPAIPCAGSFPSLWGGRWSAPPFTAPGGDSKEEAPGNTSMSARARNCSKGKKNRSSFTYGKETKKKGIKLNFCAIQWPPGDGKESSRSEIKGK